MNSVFAILVNGSINSGKTTVSKQLQSLVLNLAHIEVDTLGDFIEWLPLEEQIPLNLTNAVSVGLNFLRAGISVVVSYPLTSHEHSRLVSAFLPFPTYTFTLSPSLEVAQSRRGPRELTKWEIQRIAHHYACGIATPGFGVVLDNSTESAAATALRIVRYLRTRADNQPVQRTGAGARR
jgi:hypothetical protein